MGALAIGGCGSEEADFALRASVLAGGGQPFAVVSADFNGDGIADLAVSRASASVITLHLGHGDGTFLEASSLRTGRRPRGLVAADFDADGILDLAAAATDGNAVWVHRGLGYGGFLPPVSFSVGSRPFSLAAGDLNHDGHLDLAVANEGEREGPEEGPLSVLLGDGQGGFRVSSLASGRFGADVALGDFDGDGHPDIALATWGTNNVNLHLGRGDGTFEAQRSIEYGGHGLYRVLAADLDRDGALDLVLGDIHRTGLAVLYGDGRGDFPRRRLLRAGAGVRHAEAVDLNADGWLDLVSADTAADGISVVLSDGRGSFLPTRHFLAGAQPRALAVADLNRDGRMDVVVANLRSEDLTVFLNESPAPAPPAESAGSPQPSPKEAPEPRMAEARLELSWEYVFKSGSDANTLRALAVDASGGVYLAGDVGSGADWYVLRLSPQGERLWDYRVRGSDVELPHALALTPSGDVVTAGYVIGRAGTFGRLLATSPDGDESWIYDDAGAGDRRLFGVAADGDGNLYAVGEAQGHWRVLSLSAAGELRWEYTGDAGVARAVDVHPSSGVFVAGDGPEGWRTLQLDRAGKLLRRDGPALEPGTLRRSRLHDLRSLASGALLLSGSQTLRGKQARVEMRNADGKLVWEYVDRLGRGSVGTAVDSDGEENAILVGENAGDWLLLGLDAAGELLWRFTFDAGGKVDNPDRAHSVALHPAGGFVVGGVIHPLPRRGPSLGAVSWRVAHYRVGNLRD